jgi:hypothetical protein
MKRRAMFLCVAVLVLLIAAASPQKAMATSEWSDEFFIELPGRGDVGWDDAYRIAQRTWEVNIAPMLKGNHFLSGASPSNAATGLVLSWSGATLFVNDRVYTMASGATTVPNNTDIIWISAVALPGSTTGATVDVRAGEHYPPSSVSGWYVPIAIAKSEAGNVTRMKDIRNMGPLNASKSQPYRINLLTNSRFGAWSASDAPHKLSGVSVDAISAGQVILAASPSFTIEVGQLFTFGGSGSSPGDTGVSVYEVTSVTGQTQFQLHSTGVYTGVTNIYLTGPGGSLKTPDTWGHATGSYSAYRVQTGEGARDGSLYSAWVIKSSDADASWYWPKGWNISSNYKQYAGRTVTVASWVRCYRANSFYWTLNSGAGGGMSGVTSDPHSGNGQWEWIEKTYEIPSDAGAFYIRPEMIGPSGTSFYFTEPILVYGNAIGKGNYIAPPGEIVWFESDYIRLYNFNSVNLSADATINLEAESKGVVPKGVNAIYAAIGGTCASASQALYLSTLTSTIRYGVILHSQVISQMMSNSGWQPCDAISGDIAIRRGSTWSAIFVDILGIQYK